MKLSMTLSTAKQIASMGIFTDPNMARLSRIHLQSKGTCITAYATDRYSAIKAFFDNMIEAENGDDQWETYLDQVAIKFITGLKQDKNYRPPVFFEIDELNLTITYANQSVTTLAVPDSLPDWRENLATLVSGLFQQWQPTTEARPAVFTMPRLGSLSKLLNEHGKKMEVWEIEMGEPNKPARFTAGRFSALIQANRGLPA